MYNFSFEKPPPLPHTPHKTPPTTAKPNYPRLNGGIIQGYP